MHISAAHTNDIREFAAIEFKNMSKVIAAHAEWTEDSVEAAVGENIDRAWKLVGEDLLGFYYWAPDGDCAVLLSIQVPEPNQSRGYGSRLLEHFHREAAAHGYRKIGLAVHTHNRAYQWYLQNGFTYLEDDGTDCHMMIKELRP